MAVSPDGLSVRGQKAADILEHADTMATLVAKLSCQGSYKSVASAFSSVCTYSLQSGATRGNGEERIWSGCGSCLVKLAMPSEH